MALAQQAAGSWAFSASTSTMPTVTLGSTTVGDLNVILVAFKQIGATFTVPTGWTTLLAKTSSSNGTAYAVAAGDVSILMLGRVFVSGDTAPTLAALTGGSTTTASGNVVGINTRAYRATTGFYDVGVASFNRSTTATAWGNAFTLTVAANTGTGISSSVATPYAASDIVLSFQAPTLSTATFSALALTQTSATFSAVTNTPVAAGSTTGADLGVNAFWASVTTPGTGTVTSASTLSATAYGMQSLVRLREAPAPAITQASYRFYADGTESASTALAAQDTAYAADVTAGDVNTLLRTRLQSTNTSTPAATDDWQLQWEKNANGLWSAVSTANEALADGYDETNRNIGQDLSTAGVAQGQSFLGDGHALTRAGFWAFRGAAAVGNLSAFLYAHAGTFGVDGTATGSPLATSTSLPVTTLGTTYQWQEFTFDGTFTLAAGTPYVIVIKNDVVAGDTLFAGADGSSPTHAGNLTSLSAGVWSAASTRDLVFRVYSTPSAVVAFNSASLTDAAATTNRLGAGTGSFVAGKVSEDGLIDDLGWTANNFTEALYTLTLKQAGLADTDTLRFRVQRNGATTGLTYTQTPTINVTKSSGAVTQPPRNIHLPNPMISPSLIR
jgi:hypothetical protein